MYYYIAFVVAFICILFHTVAHVLEHYGKIRTGKGVHIAIDTSMFIGWFSYFFMSLYDFNLNLSLSNYIGLILLILGFYLFIASGKKVHGRLHRGEGGLIKTGIYKNIRHPMYLGQILIFIGAPVFGSSLMTLALSPLFIVQILVWRHFEEKELISEFPKEYPEYMKRTWF